jgi:Rrf2 family protein
VRISAKADYAVRAAAELAAGWGSGPVKADTIARAQAIPPRFLFNILVELKHAGLVHSRRGAEGGFDLARPPAQVTLADVIRAVEGPLATIQDARPEQTTYPGAAAALSDVWIAVRASLRSVLEEVTLADLVSGNLPAAIRERLSSPEARVSH